MKLNLALAAALSLANNNVVSISAELAAEEFEELNTLVAEEIKLEEQNEEIIEELSSLNLAQTRFDVDPLIEEMEVVEESSSELEGMELQSDTLEGGDIVLNFDAPDLRVEEGGGGEGYDELPDGAVPIQVSEEVYTTSAMEEEEEEVVIHVPTKHELHHAAKIAAKANKHPDMLSKAHSMKSTEVKKHSKSAKAIHGSKGSKRGKMGKGGQHNLSMPTHFGKANEMPIHHEAKTHKTPSNSIVKSTSQSDSSSKANKTTDITEVIIAEPGAEIVVVEEDDGTVLNMDPVPRTPDVPPTHTHIGTDTSELNGRLKQEMAEVILGDTSHVISKGHSQSNENVAALDLLRAKSDAAAQSSGGSVGRRSVGIVGGVCLVSSILYGMTMV